jgi:hypothetical protein
MWLLLPLPLLLLLEAWQPTAVVAVTIGAVAPQQNSRSATEVHRMDPWCPPMVHSWASTGWSTGQPALLINTK